MGDFVGHAVPGAMFLLLSIWWFLGTLLQARKNSSTQSTRGLLRSSGSSNTRLKSHSNSPVVWYPCPGRTLSKIPLEPIIKVLFAVTGVIGELFFDGSWILNDKNGNFVPEHLNNYSHAAMYCFFGLSGVVDIVMWHGSATLLPPKFNFAIMSACFWVEGFLFYFHLKGHSEISVRLHTILYVIIFVTAFMFLVDVFSTQHQQLFGLMRAILLGVQGTWFLQIAFVLYGPSRWQDTPSNVEFLSIAFAWHLFIFIFVTVVLLVAFHCFYRKKNPRETGDPLQEALSDDDEEEAVPLETL